MNPLIIVAIAVAVVIIVCLIVVLSLKKKGKKTVSNIATDTASDTETAITAEAEDDKIIKSVEENEVSATTESVSEDKEKEESDDKIIIIPRVSKRPFFLYDFYKNGDSGLTVGGLEDVAFSKKPKKKVPFYKNLLKAEKAVKLSYDEIYNKFLEYKKLHARVSSKCTSFRFGRELVAKLTYHGRTMKLHLALDVDKYNVNKYHQKDLKNKKSYEEVPFTVKVKSERARKNAIELITLLAEEKQFSVKKNIEKFDSIKELKNMKK